MKKVEKYFAYVGRGKDILIKYVPEDETLFYYGKKHYFKKEDVVIAMLAVARYLGWNYSKKNLDNYKSALTTISYSGKTVYLNHKKVVLLNKYDNVVYAELSKKELLSAIKEFYYFQNCNLIPRFAFEISEHAFVKLDKMYIRFNQDDYKMADEKFVDFINQYCRCNGNYYFEPVFFIENTGIPTLDWARYYLTERYKMLKLECNITSVKVSRVEISFNFTL